MFLVLAFHVFFVVFFPLFYASANSNGRYLEISSSSGCQDGSTAAFVLIERETYENITLFAANAGDSRVVLSHKGTAIAMSVDHKPNRPDERQRIEDAGGDFSLFVIVLICCISNHCNPTCGQVESFSGELGVSRAYWLSLVQLAIGL
jgi:hypothetical protein